MRCACVQRHRTEERGTACFGLLCVRGRPAGLPPYARVVEFAFSGTVVEWRGPSPYHFVVVPGDDAAEIADVAASVTYVWGMIPVEVRIGSTVFTTSLWPRSGTYYLPLRDAVRAEHGIGIGDRVKVRMRLRPR